MRELLAQTTSWKKDGLSSKRSHQRSAFESEFKRFLTLWWIIADHHVAVPWVRHWEGLLRNKKSAQIPRMPILLVGCPGIDPTGLPHDTCLIFVSLFIDPLFSLWEIVERAYENENFSTSASCYTKNKCSQENTVVKNRGLYFGIWRLGGGGRQNVMIFSPHKTSPFCYSPRPRNIIQAKAFTKCFRQHRRSILNRHQISDPLLFNPDGYFRCLPPLKFITCCLRLLCF